MPWETVMEPTETEPTTSLPSSPPLHRPRWMASVAFFAGGSLTALSLAVALQAGAFDAWANIRPPASVMAPAVPADPRIERLVKLLESERDCDSDCLADLRGRADKSAALEQALDHLQEAAATAEQRVATLENEKAGLAGELTQKLSEAEADFKQKLAALEGEKTGLAGQLEKRTAEQEARHQQQVDVLEAEKAALKAEYEKKASVAEAGYQQKLVALQKQLTDVETRLQPAAARQEPMTWRKGKPVRNVPAPVPVAADTAPPHQAFVARAPASPAEAPKWTVLGMTATAVVVSTVNHRVVALAAGESLDGVKVQRIDLDHGVAETSAGNLTYRQ
jgi:hypothetical protein